MLCSTCSTLVFPLTRYVREERKQRVMAVKPLSTEGVEIKQDFLSDGFQNVGINGVQQHLQD